MQIFPLLLRKSCCFCAWWNCLVYKSSASQNVPFLLLVQVFRSQLALGLAGGTRQGGFSCPWVSPALSSHCSSPFAWNSCNSLLSRAEAAVGSVFLVLILLNKHGQQALNQLNYWADYSIVSRSQCFLLVFLCYGQEFLHHPSCPISSLCPQWWDFLQPDELFEVKAFVFPPFLNVLQSPSLLESWASVELSQSKPV